VSRSGRYVAYQVSRNAADEATLHFIEVESGRELARDAIEGAKYSWEIGWSLNDEGVYYTWVPAPGAVPVADRPGHAEIRYHRFGTVPVKDPTVWQKSGDPTTFVTASTDWDDAPYLYLVVRHGWVSEDVRVLDLRDKKAGWQNLAVGRGAHFEPFSFGGKFYVRTDEGAPRGRVYAVDPKKLARDAWVEIVPEHPSRALEWARPIGNRLVLGYLDDVKSRIQVHDWNGALERELGLPGIGSATLVGHPKDDAATLEYTTFTQPPQLFRTSVTRGESKLEYQVEVPFDPTPFVVEQVFAPSKDGTRVPAFVVRRSAASPGPVPALLYGYGGYASSLTPMFWSSIIPWLERGGVAVFANLRGGGEYGEAWHRLGMRHHKQNVFDDFRAVATHLVTTGVTRPELLAIRGESNGGLLVGAALTQNPELYRVALCGVPLLDMVRYHRFGSGKTWIDELGSADDLDDFRALFSYSPYHHVADGVRYPSLLLLSATDDDRVDPMHARKFAALLQARSRGGVVLLRIEENSGHAGADTIKSLVEQRAHAFAFAMNEVGLR
jgi:prolyl oligopeptidase